MTQDEYEVEQEYYETECDFSDFEPTVPMPDDPPVTFDDERPVFHSESIRLLATIFRYYKGEL